MNINVMFGSLLVVALSLLITNAFFNMDKPPPSELPWVPIDVRKSRSFHSQTRDAGLYTEATRRKAIIGNPDLKVGYKGSTNGSMEWNFLTGICVCPPRGKPICPTDNPAIWSANGAADGDICDIVDGGAADGIYDVIDLGGAEANVCDV
jgi:hypothetical protein